MFDIINRLSQSAKKSSRAKFYWSNIGQAFWYLFDMGVEEFKKIFLVIRNRGRWSDKVAAASPKAMLGKVVLEKILFFL